MFLASFLKAFRTTVLLNESHSCLHGTATSFGFSYVEDISEMVRWNLFRIVVVRSSIKLFSPMVFKTDMLVSLMFAS